MGELRVFLVKINANHGKFTRLKEDKPRGYFENKLNNKIVFNSFQFDKPFYQGSLPVGASVTKYEPEQN